VLVAGSLSWLADVLHVLTPGERVAGGAVLAGFGSLVALPYGLWGLAAGWLGRRGVRGWQLWQAPGVLLVQGLVHDGWLGFPWLHYGYWLASGPWGAWLGVLGAWGSGLLPLHLAACLGGWRSARGARWQALGVAGALGAALVFPGGDSPPGDTRPIQVAAITVEQGQVEDSERDDVALLSRSVVATRRAEAEWILWPESVIRDGGASLPALGEVLGQPGRRLFAGALLPAPGGRYNALVELPGGRPVYYKRERVPFSEYVPGEPLRRLFRELGVSTLKADVVAWQGPQPALEVDGVEVVPLLCYEVAFTELIHPGERPAVLFNVGNERWFRQALVRRMTLAMGMARSSEYGIPLVRSVAGGASGFFDPASGRWRGEPEEGSGVASHQGQVLPRPAATLYARWARLRPWRRG
jgi:apolipoprotein N-acyltransferase